jgi:hypothetical protein
MALKNFAKRKIGSYAPAMQQVQSVPNPTPVTDPNAVGPLAGSAPTVSPAPMKKGGKVAGKLAIRGYGKVR